MKNLFSKFLSFPEKLLGKNSATTKNKIHQAGKRSSFTTFTFNIFKIDYFLVKQNRVKYRPVSTSLFWTTECGKLGIKAIKRFSDFSALTFLSISGIITLIYC